MSLSHRLMTASLPLTLQIARVGIVYVRLNELATLSALRVLLLGGALCNTTIRRVDRNCESLVSFKNVHLRKHRSTFAFYTVSLYGRCPFV